MVVSRLAASLDPTRFRPIVCLFHPGWLEHRCLSQGVETHVIPIHGMFDWKWGRQFYKFLKSNRVRLVHAHEFTANTYGALVARLAGVPVVATIHGKSYFVDQLKRRLAYRATCRMATTVVVSEDLKRFVCMSLGISPRLLQVVYNGVPETELSSEASTTTLREELSIPTDHRIVGVIGSLYPVKGHTYLLQAIPDIVKAKGNTTFVLIGRGELEAQLRKQANDLGVDRHVRILGFRDDVPRLLRLIDVFVLPSLSEGLSVAILEAMAAGKPVVATQVGGNAELIVDGETGYLVPPMNPSALAAHILALLGDDSLRHRLGDAGRRRVAEAFSLQQMVKSYEQLYDRCIANA